MGLLFEKKTMEKSCLHLKVSSRFHEDINKKTDQSVLMQAEAYVKPFLWLATSFGMLREFFSFIFACSCFFLTRPGLHSKTDWSVC